jgi:pimeloyl-ACP methyl ester carboxylesterase
VSINALAIVLLAAPVPAPEDTLLDVGGYHLHLVVHRGTSPLTIVMESGGGASLDDWAGLDSTLARRTGTTVVAYDRAGFGRSETGPADLTPEQQVRQVSLALERLGTPSSRVVIGHSYGGLLAVMHGHLYADQVRGLVLVDPMKVRFVRATGDFVRTTVPHIEHPVTAQDSAIARMVSGFDRLVASPSSAHAGLDLPIVVITAGEAWWGKPEIDREWRAAHQAIAKAKPGRRLIVAERSKHQVPQDRPDTILEAVASLAGDRAAGR